MKSMITEKFKSLSLAALLIASATFAACSSDDNTIDQQPAQPAGQQVYTMTVNAQKGGDAATTRALRLDDKTLNATWATTENIYVKKGDTWATGSLKPQTDGTTATLKGTLSGITIAGSDVLTLQFPKSGDISYDGQLGTLEDIAANFDYATATVTVASVSATGNITPTEATTTFQNQQAIVKFTLQDNGGNAINATSLNISASSNKLVKNKSYRGAGTKTYYYGNSYYTVDNGSGGFDGEQHGNLVDNDLNTKWCQDKPSGNWYIEFHTASAIQVDGYMLRTGKDTWPETGRNPQSWVLYGKKNSGDSWSVIDTKTDNYDMPNASNAEQDFDADAPGQYQYFRLEISAIRGGNCMQMSEMRLFSYEYFEMGTTYGGLTVTPANATNEMTVALRNENASADTYTLTATVGGATYSFSQSDVTFENGKYYAITVKMQPKKVSSITLNKSSINLTIGSTQTLSVSSVAPDDAVDKSVTWSSNATGVATVDPTTGEVTAVAEGTATITATANDGSGKTATCSVTVYPEGTKVWDSSNCSDIYVSGTYASYTKEGITLSANADEIFATWNSGYYSGISFNAYKSGGFTFSNTLSKNFTKIEMTLNGPAGWDMATLGTGWSYSEDTMKGIYKVTWTDTATNTVDLLTGADMFNGESVKSIVFFMSE